MVCRQPFPIAVRWKFAIQSCRSFNDGLQGCVFKRINELDVISGLIPEDLHCMWTRGVNLNTPKKIYFFTVTEAGVWMWTQLSRFKHERRAKGIPDMGLFHWWLRYLLQFEAFHFPRIATFNHENEHNNDTKLIDAMGDDQRRAWTIHRSPFTLAVGMWVVIVATVGYNIPNDEWKSL